MADLGGGSSGYPSAIDTATDEQATDSTDYQKVNGGVNAVIAVQTELGTDPAGSLADVKTRLAVNLNNDGTMKNFQTVKTIDNAVSAALSTNIPFDDTIPQNTEGDEVITRAITPVSASNILVIDAIINMSAAAAEHLIVALFQDTTANALAVTCSYVGAADKIVAVALRHVMAAGTTSSTTFKIRIGSAAQNVVMNGIVTGPARRFGGVCASLLRVSEFEV